MVASANALRVLSLLPDGLVIELQSIANDTRQHSWRIGQVAREIIDLIEAQPDKYPGFGKLDVFDAVATALEHEYSPRTIRDFVHVYESFTDAERYKFSDMPFAHFRFAASLGPQKIGCLEIAAHRMGETGRPPSVDWLYNQFFGQSPAQPQESGYREFDSQVAIAGQRVEKIKDEMGEDGTRYCEDRGIPVEFEAACQVLHDSVSGLSLPDWVKLRLRRLLEEIKSLIVDNVLKV